MAIGVVGRAPVDADDVGAELQRQFRRARADAGRDAGDDDGLAVEHGRSPRCASVSYDRPDFVASGRRRASRRPSIFSQRPTGSSRRPKPLVDPAPEALGQEQREQQRGGAEADQIPDAGRAEPGLDRKEQHGAEDRPLERAEAADQHHEDHIGGPLHAEIGLRLEGDGGGEPERAGQRDAEGGEDEDDPLGAHHPHADGGRGLLVVADRLDRGAERRAQQARTECR